MLLKTKDYFTLGNALCGFLSTVSVMRADLDPVTRLRWGSYFIVVAWIFDVLDGLVARLTHQHNKFGRELDNVADLIAYSVAPSFLLYGIFTMHPTHPHLPWWAAAAVGSMPLVAGCIRFARFNVKRISYDGAWIGFPRPASAFLIVGYFNSVLANSYESLYWFGIFVVFYCSAMHFVLVPFYNHHRSSHPFYMWVSFWFIGSSVIFGMVVDFITGAGVTFDVLTIWLLLYLFAHRYFVYSKKERRAIKKFVDEWKADEAKA